VKVHLFVPCMADAFVPEVGLAAADCLAAAGCEVVFDPRQTCCGQMFANSGMEREAGRLARRFVGVFRDAEYVVGPSGSCTGFVRERYGRLLRRGPELDDWRALRGRVFELTGFLTGVLGISAWAGRFESRATLHWSCHMPQDGAAQGAVEGLLRGIEGLELTADERRRYEASATEQEIAAGALSVADAGAHVFCFLRRIEGLPDDTSARDFTDQD